MDKDEILARSRMDNRRWDERERRVTDEAGTWGGGCHGHRSRPCLHHPHPL